MADPNNDAALAGEYAMGLLQGAEARVFEDRLTREPDLRALYAAWADDLAVLEADPLPAPDGIKSAVDMHLFGPPETLWDKLRGFVVLGTGVAALAVLVTVGVQFLPSSADYSVQMTADNLDVEADVFADDRTVRVAVATSQAPDGKDHELWIIPAGQAPISLGVLKDGPVILPAGIALPGAVLAVTVEAQGGSPNGVPTTSPIAVVSLDAA